MGWLDKPARRFFSKKEEKQRSEAIRNAESKTSGEIRLHLEDHCKHGDALSRAWQVFHELEMGETAERNGVLIYLAVQDHQFALIADAGIDEAVPEDFWDQVVNEMQDDFRNGNFLSGILKGVHQAGEKLQTFFPRKVSDQNELTDDISYG